MTKMLCNSSEPAKPQEKRFTASSRTSPTGSICRICQMSSTSSRPLISPCDCKGSLAFVHLSCLERWLNTSSRNSCELCNFQFDARKTRRYTLCQSLALWVRHPVNRRNIQADLFILMLLSIVTLGLVLICILGLDHFVVEGKKYGMSKMWTKGALGLFLMVVLMGYVCSVGFLVRDQLKPWYRWWSNTYNIELHFDMSSVHCSTARSLINATISDQTANLHIPTAISQTRIITQV